MACLRTRQAVCTAGLIDMAHLFDPDVDDREGLRPRLRSRGKTDNFSPSSNISSLDDHEFRTVGICAVCTTEAGCVCASPDSETQSCHAIPAAILNAKLVL